MSEDYGNNATPGSLFATSYAYTMRKLVGADSWNEWLGKELSCLGESRLPGFQCLAQAALLGEPLSIAVNATVSIGRSRSSMAGVFLRGKADVWLTVDDDNYANTEVLSRLVAAARETQGVVAAPYWLRQTKPRMSFRSMQHPAPVDGHENLLSSPDLLFGFGLVALHRSAVERVAATVPQIVDGEGGEPFPGLFLEMVHNGVWIGEDFAFCHRARGAGVPLYLLTGAWVQHDNLQCLVKHENGQLLAQHAVLDTFASSRVARSTPEEPEPAPRE